MSTSSTNIVRPNTIPSPSYGGLRNVPSQNSNSGLRGHPDEHPQVFVNAIYYPNYKVYKGESPLSFNFNLISHVFYAFAGIREDGTIYLSDQWADCDVQIETVRGCLNAFTLLKARYSHLKVLLSVGGSGGGMEYYPSIASSKDKRERFAISAKALLDEYGLDGIDVNWDHPSSKQEGSDFTALLATVRHILPSPLYNVTAALPAGVFEHEYIDLVATTSYLDFLNIKAYDFCGPWRSTSDHHAQLFSPEKPLSDAAKLSASAAVTQNINLGVASCKIVLGIPAYGRSFLGATGINQPYDGTGGNEGLYDFKELPRPGSIEYIDETVVAAWCVGDDGGFVSYDSTTTVKLKSEYVKSSNLGGVFFWPGPGDVFTGAGSLVQTAFSVLHSEYQ